MGAGIVLRQWQREALDNWRGAGHRGIIEVVTGGGKTVFALACISDFQPETTLVVVPTLALMDQWWAEAATFFGLRLDDIHIVADNGRMQTGTINIAVLNTASRLVAEGKALRSCLIVDECHKAASPKFSAVLGGRNLATLGLSATPERPYDSGLDDILVPALGPVIYRYSYREALRDGVIVPFDLKNVVFDLEDDRMAEYDRLTKAIARNMQKYGPEAQETISLLLRRTRVLNLSLNRVRLTLKLIKAHHGARIIVFHEDIEACNLIQEVLTRGEVRSGVYHSKMGMRQRAEVLSAYREGSVDVLITCRALDEGFNVPETEVGIIAASTATRRQRIQRLGRVLRPVKGKDSATIYTLVATKPEIARLEEEEKELEGVAHVTWGHA